MLNPSWALRREFTGGGFPPFCSLSYPETPGALAEGVMDSRGRKQRNLSQKIITQLEYENVTDGGV